MTYLTPAEEAALHTTWTRFNYRERQAWAAAVRAQANDGAAPQNVSQGAQQPRASAPPPRARLLKELLEASVHDVTLGETNPTWDPDYVHLFVGGKPVA